MSAAAGDAGGVEAANGLFATWAEQRQQPGFVLEALNHLSAPKGTRYLCELTGAPASVRMVTPYMTLYYASKDDAVLSWEGIMHKLLPLLSQLRSKPAIIGSEEERQKREYAVLMSKRALIDLTRNVSTKFLIQAEFDLAVPGAVQSMAFSKEVYGEDAVELVPAFLLLAQCYLGQRRFRSAQEYLGFANWIVLKTPDAGNATRAQLHRTFGTLCAAQGKHQEAATHLAKDVYWLSLEHGPEHVVTSTSYFHLAAVFEAQHRMEAQLALLDKIVDIWYKYLSAARIAGPEEVAPLSEAQCVEAVQMLSKILAMREQVLGENHIATGEAHYVLGLLRFMLGHDRAVAQHHVAAAHQVYVTHLGSHHRSTLDAAELLTLISEPAAPAAPAAHAVPETAPTVAATVQ